MTEQDSRRAIEAVFRIESARFIGVIAAMKTALALAARFALGSPLNARPLGSRRKNG